MNDTFTYEIEVAGALDARWEDWFQGMRVTGQGAQVTRLRGELPDQAALHGVLAAIRDLNLTLISVRQIKGAVAQSKKEAHDEHDH